MKSLLQRTWNEDQGVLSFEWILLITVLVIGIVGGLSAVRDAMITELGDVAEAMISLDQSYTIVTPWEVVTPDCQQDGASDSSYTDEASLSQGRYDPAVSQEITGQGATGVSVGPCGNAESN